MSLPSLRLFAGPAALLAVGLVAVTSIVLPLSSGQAADAPVPGALGLEEVCEENKPRGWPGHDSPLRY